MKIDADAAGMDAGRLSRIDEHLRTRYVDPGKIAGCQVAVLRRGAVAHFSSMGFADRERQVPVAEDTIWRIFSMTKPITGVAMMTLYERGHFQLTDPVSKFLPEWKDLKVGEAGTNGEVRLVEPQRPMQIRDLMMHTSGLGYGPNNQDLNLEGRLTERTTAPNAEDNLGDDDPPPLALARDLETLVSRAAGWPLRYHPGTRWLYAFGLEICGRLIEIMSGQRFDDFLNQEVFGPIGMPDTAFSVPESQASRLAAGYARNSRKQLVLVDDPTRSPYLRHPSFLSGGGGLVSTTADYLRFCQMLLDGGEIDGRRVLGRKTVDLMTRNHLRGGRQLRDLALPGGYGEIGFDGVGFGLSMAVNTGPVESGVIGSAGDYSWGGAASTIFWVDPVEDLIVVFMTQLLPSGTFDFRNQLKAIVYPAIAD